MTDWGKIRETIPLIIAPNRKINLGVNLTTEVKDSYDKNFKCLKKISEVRKISHVYGVVELTVKMTILLQENL